MAHSEYALTGLPCVPRHHVCGGADRFFCVKDWFQRQRILKTDSFPYVLDDFVHVQRYDNAPPQVILIEERRVNLDLVAFDETLDQSNQLS
jgi:hypothetical protein